MRYLMVVLVWLSLSALWGLVGSLIGPGIVMLIIALMIGSLGSCVTVIKLLCGYQVRGLVTGVLVTIVSTLLVYALIVDIKLTWPVALFLVVFISILSFVASFLVNFLLDKTELE